MKNTKVLSRVFLLPFLSFFAACQFQPESPKQADQASAGLNREYLALLKARDNHTVDFEVLEGLVAGFTNPQQTGSDVAIEEKTTIVKVDKLSVIGEKRFATGARGRSAAGTEQEPVEVYAFITQKLGNENPGYVLASNDIRVGNFLAIVEEGSLDSEELAWFHDIVYEGIGAYIDRIIEEYDSISDEEVKRAVERSAARTNVNQTATGSVGWEYVYDANLVGGYYNHVNSSYNNVGYIKVKYNWFDGYYAALSTEWSQDYPYNHIVNGIRSGIPGSYQFRAGSGPIAMGQIMAYHKKPASSTFVQNKPNRPTYNYVDAADRVYNWNDMVSDARKTSEYDSGAMDIAKLMYEIGERTNATYNSWGETDIYPSAIISAFQAMGYTTPGNFLSYTATNFPTLIASIKAKRPVIVFGYAADNSSYAWVIDAVRQMSYFEELYDSNGYYITEVGGPFTGPGRENQYFDWVHCNLGWGDSRNAWYASGIFDCRSGYQAHARAAIDNYFTNGLQFLPNIR